MARHAPVDMSSDPKLSLLVALSVLAFGVDRLPAQEPLQIPIAEAIQDLDGNSVPDRLGQRVVIEGIVTADPISLGIFGHFTVVEDDAAIVLFAPDTTQFSALRAGLRVSATGLVAQFRGQEQILVEALAILGEADLPPVLHLSAAEIGKAVSGRIVSVSGRLEVQESAGQLLGVVRDETGEAAIYFEPPLFTDPELFDRIVRSSGRRVSITGIALQSVDFPQVDAGYYLYPRSHADLDFPPVLRIREMVAVLVVILLAAGLIFLGRRHRRAERIVVATSAFADRLLQSEAALRESEGRYRSLVDSVPLGLYQISPAERVLSANPALTDLLGFRSFEEFAEAGLASRYVSDDQRIRLHRVAVEFGSVQGVESTWRRRDGAAVIVRQTVRAHRGSSGEILYFEGLVEDITARRQAEQKLRAAEARVTQLVGTSPTIIYAVELRGGEATLTWISESVTDIIGYSTEEALANSWWVDGLHPDERPTVLRAFAQFLTHEGPGARIAHEYRFRHKDGNYRWFRNDLRIASKSEGRVEAVGASIDVTAEKQISLALVDAEARYRRLVETSPYGIFEVDAAGRVREANPALGEFFGVDASDVVGRTVRDLVAQESHPTIRAAMEKLDQNPGGHFDNEVWIVRTSGERRLVHIRSTSIIREGKISGAHGVVRDITLERIRENRVRLLGAALENLGHGVAVSNMDGDLIYANTEFTKMLAFTPLDGQLPSLEDFLPDEAARAQMEAIGETLRATGRWSGRIWRRRAADGKVIPIDAVIGVVPGPEGDQPHALTIYNDASESIEREQQLRRAERLSSLGTLVGGVAHELNNPLNAIINFAALLLTEVRSQEERQDLETIVREGERAAKIVANLRLVARQAEIEQAPKERVDVNDVVSHVLKLRAYSLANSNIRVESVLEPDLPPIWGDRGQMEQVVLNLVVNGEQAMAASRGEGTLRVLTSIGPLGVRIEVSDDGPGIPSTQVDRIFDPFWTTKAPGEGTGLGLSLVHNIVAESGGSVDVRSVEGHGASFIVDMPTPPNGLDPDPVGAHISDAHDHLPVDPIRILVVEDEAAVRQSIVRYLARLGHTVDDASDGSEALRLLGDRAPYDLILSDLRMPGLSGEQFLERLKKTGAGMEERILFMTGDATGAGEFLGGAPLLIKPVKLTEIARAIQECLARVEVPSMS
jgi:two-component system, cell cycle sensor histidine kinase and response regulator CckA